jgi:hypothetical protein
MEEKFLKPLVTKGVLHYTFLEDPQEDFVIPGLTSMLCLSGAVDYYSSSIHDQLSSNKKGDVLKSLRRLGPYSGVSYTRVETGFTVQPRKWEISRPPNNKSYLSRLSRYLRTASSSTKREMTDSAILLYSDRVVGLALNPLYRFHSTSPSVSVRTGNYHLDELKSRELDVVDSVGPLYITKEVIYLLDNQS